MKIEKVLTDSPYVDELVYYVKVLCYGCVLKNGQKALDNETLDSLKESGKYIACMEGTAIFDQLDYPLPVLIACGFSESTIDAALIDKYNIPEDKRDLALKVASQYTIDNYVELNNYYRMLNGIPDVGDPGIKVTDWVPPADVIVNLDNYVHEMSSADVEILIAFGIIDELIEKYPQAEYLKHLGQKKVGYYDARKAFNFQTLYLPTVDSAEIYDRFKDKLDINRDYTVKTIYSEAYKYGSDYYDAFISVLIIVQTMIDMLCEIQELIAKKEILDLRCIQYIFESYGIPFFPDIPMKYQIAMVKNINKLLKFKSTSKGMIDICSLFGFDNVEVFKYYLLRDRRINTITNDYEYYYKEIEDPNNPGETIIVDDNGRNYDLKFLRVPLNENPDSYLRDPSNYLDYDDVTLSDKTWDGELDHDYIKSQIIEKEFNYVRSKYISIDTIYDVTQLAFQMPYFFNMIFDEYKVEEQLVLSIPYLNPSHEFKMVDVFSYLYALTYYFYNIKDSIMDTNGKVLHVLGFNFRVNLAELGAYVAEKGFTLEELGVADFMIPQSSILSYNQLMDIFVKNGKIREHLVKQIINADNKKIYDIYTQLYNALMITEFTNGYYKDPDTGLMPKTYTEYLQRRDSILYNSLLDIAKITDENTRLQTITTIINNVVYALDEYIDSGEFKYIYSNLPSVSSESIKSYVIKVIDFFKSFKVDFLGMNTIYRIDDKLDNTVKIIDDIDLLRVLFKQDTMKIFDWIKENKTSFNPKEKFAPIEKLYFDISWWRELTLSTDVGNTIKEYIVNMLVTMMYHTNVEIDDRFESMIANIEYKNYFTMEEIKYITSKLFYTENANVDDIINGMLISITANTVMEYNDHLYINSTSNKKTKVSVIDLINKIESKFDIKEKALFIEKLYIEASTIGFVNVRTIVTIDELINYFIRSYIKRDRLDIKEVIDYLQLQMNMRNKVVITDIPFVTSELNINDKISLDEMIYIERSFS